MNRYYVEEGNKRVSVLRFFNAYSVPANVIRVMPSPSDDEAVQRYMAFVDFNRLTKVNFLELSDRESYRALLRLLGCSGTPWSDEERRQFSAVYYRFEQAFEAVGGKTMTITAGDAMLSCMEIYGYAGLSHTTTEEMKTILRKMWEEVALKENNKAIEVKTAPAEARKQNVFSRLLPVGKQPVLKAAFLYDGTPDHSGWVNDHELGRQYVQQIFDGQIETSAYPNAMRESLEQVIQQAIRDGSKVIFTTSPRMLQESLRAAVEYPDITVMNCSLNISHRYVRTYYPRMYEVKFILLNSGKSFVIHGITARREARPR